MKTLFSAIVLIFSLNCSSGELTPFYIQKLKKVEKVEKGSNDLYKVIRDSSIELSKDWNDSLALEIGRVFNDLLSTNPNYFVLELIMPIKDKYPKKFEDFLLKKLTPENKLQYEDHLKMLGREIKEGNG